MWQSAYGYLTSLFVKQPNIPEHPVFIKEGISTTPIEATALAAKSGYVRKPWKIYEEGSSLHVDMRKTTLTKEQLRDKIKGCIYGAAIGDAVGLATEFMTKKEAAERYPNASQFQFSDRYEDMHRSVFAKGDWTDDTDQMLLIVESVIANQKVVEKDFAKRLFYWFKHGFPELGDLCGLGVGQTVYSVLRHPKFQTHPHLASKEVWESKGKVAAANGAIMRAAPLGIIEFDNVEHVINNTIAIAKVTHYDPRCVSSSIIITTIISSLLQGNVDVEEILHNAHQHASQYIMTSNDISEESKLNYINEIEQYLHSKDLEALNLDVSDSIGYTLKTMAAAVCVFSYFDDFKDAMIRVMMEAGDADTNACVGGALLGTKLGYSKLPQEWVSSLIHHHFLDEHINELFSVMKI